MTDTQEHTSLSTDDVVPDCDMFAICFVQHMPYLLMVIVMVNADLYSALSQSL